MSSDTDLFMLELFCTEAAAQGQVLSTRLEGAMAAAPQPQELEELMRAAHSLKGAARIINLASLSDLAAAMEDAFNEVIAGKATLGLARLDPFLAAADLFLSIGRTPPASLTELLATQQETVARLTAALRGSEAESGGEALAVRSSMPKPGPALPDSGSADEGSASNEFGGISMAELFRSEAESQCALLSDKLLALEEDPTATQLFEPLMRAAHSLKGAARVVNLELAVRIAHVMEDCFVAAGEGRLEISDAAIDCLLRGVDMLAQLAEHAGTHRLALLKEPCETLVEDLHATLEGRPPLFSPPDASGDIPFAEVLDADAHADHLHPAPPAAATPSPAAAPLDELDETPDEGSEVLGRSRFTAPAPPPQASPAAQPPPPQATPPSRPAFDPLSVPKRVVIDIDPLAATMALTGSRDTPAAQTPPASKQPQQHPSAATINQPASKSATAQPSARSTQARTPGKQTIDAGERVVRLSAEHLNRLMGLAGESMVEAGRLTPFAKHLDKLKRSLIELSTTLNRLADNAETTRDARLSALCDEARLHTAESRQQLAASTAEIQEIARRSDDLAGRLYREVIASRMRPFADGCKGFPRLVRDLARTLGKRARLELIGQNTEVDRDILERLEAPLNHLLRNALDHGLETPDARTAVGKSPEGRITLEARHHAGMLNITVSDDGKGVDLEHIRGRIVQRNMITAEIARDLSEAELLDFMYLPGFSTAATVTEISGRGVGLNVVQSMVQEVAGTIRTTTQLGRGTTFHLLLPITLSVINAVLVEIAGEPYAFPLTRIDRILTLPYSKVEQSENRQNFLLEGKRVSIVPAQQVLELDTASQQGDELCLVLLSEGESRYAIAVDRFLGERQLVLRPLGTRLGKVQNISSASLLDDGSVVLVIDADDLLRTTDNLITGGRLRKLRLGAQKQASTAKRILVVEDSIVVREVQRQLLVNRGYEVDVAVDGVDGWNAVRSAHYDLVISDVDMPRMNGIELVGQIKADAKLSAIPVVIVSYKDREEDRMRGLQAGADYYLTKAQFHDQTFLQAIEDLIGKARTA